MQPGSDQPRWMGDVRHELRTDVPRDVGERLEVDRAGEGRAARDDELRAMLLREVAHLVEIDQLGIAPYPVGGDGVELARIVDRATRGQVAAVGQIGPEHGVAWLEDREVNGHVRLSPGVRLDVGVLDSEELLR